MFAFIDRQNNVIGISEDAIPFSPEESADVPDSNIRQCVEINDQKFLDSIIYMPVLDEKLQPTSDTYAVVSPGWKYIDGVFTFNNINVNSTVPKIDLSYPWPPSATSNT